MIEDYTDHAANERTYLAWVRTALAFMAFGLAVLVLFAVAVLLAHRPRPPRPLHELQLKLDPSRFLEPESPRDPLDPAPATWQSNSVDRLIEERSGE